jgi:hypothetical protein
MRFSLLLTALSFALPLTTALYPPYDYSNEHELPTSSLANVSYSEPVRLPLKYQDWYDRYRATMFNISEGVCNLSLRAYTGDMDARIELGPVRNYCFTHFNCMMGTLNERIKASFAGTSILLGLAPTTLSVLGPSVAEIALLSFHRPFLSLLLSLGAPAIYPGRFLLWEDPLRANEPTLGSFIIPPLPKVWSLVILLLEYILAGGAFSNIIHAAYRIGTRSISTWSCDTVYWPILWIMMSMVIHFIATMSLRFAIVRKREGGERVEMIERYAPVREDEKMARGGVVGLLRKEATLSCNERWQVSDYYNMRPGPLAVSLQASSFGFSDLAPYLAKE